MTEPLVMLDCFCGLKGASQAMRDRGWSVVTVDNDPAMNPDILADMRLFSWDGSPPDLLWASPPCEDFAREFMPWSRRGRDPDLSLVKAVYRVVLQSKPRFWILENVKGAQRYLGPAKWIRNPVYLWGEFPPLDCDVRPWKESLSGANAAERAAMPYGLSLAVALSIESAIRWPLER